MEVVLGLGDGGVRGGFAGAGRGHAHEEAACGAGAGGEQAAGLERVLRDEPVGFVFNDGVDAVDVVVEANGVAYMEMEAEEEIVADGYAGVGDGLAERDGG